MLRADIGQLQLSDGSVDPFEQELVFGDRIGLDSVLRLDLQHIRRVFRKGLMIVHDEAEAKALLKLKRDPLHLLFRFARGHIKGRYPCFEMTDLLPRAISPARYGDFEGDSVFLFDFLNGCHDADAPLL